MKAVLDYFNLEDVTLLGMSLGGCLATRAAAFEPRVTRVIAFDVMFDFFDCLTSRRKNVQPLLSLMTRLGLNPLLDIMAYRMMKTDLLSNWGIHHGMYVMGCDSPSAFFKKLNQYTTKYISARVKQDFLLMAGAEDHFIPLYQFHQQAQALVQVRSLTARVFTREEEAQNHCQVGNIGLALRLMVNWMEQE